MTTLNLQIRTFASIITTLFFLASHTAYAHSPTLSQNQVQIVQQAKRLDYPAELILAVYEHNVKKHFHRTSIRLPNFAISLPQEIYDRYLSDVQCKNTLAANVIAVIKYLEDLEAEYGDLDLSLNEFHRTIMFFKGSSYLIRSYKNSLTDKVLRSYINYQNDETLQEALKKIKKTKKNNNQKPCEQGNIRSSHAAHSTQRDHRLDLIRRWESIYDR